MTQPLDPGAVDANVVGGPAAPEVLAASGQLAHQVGEPPVVGITAGFGTDQGDSVVGHDLPVAEQRDRARVEEDQAGVVHRLAGVVQGREQRPSEPVVREHVEPAVEDHYRHGWHRVDQALNRRPDPIRRRCTSLPGPGRRTGGAEQVEQVRPLGAVEPQRLRDALDDAFGDAGGVAALQADVVLRGDPDQERRLLPAQSRHPAAVSAVGGKARLLRGDPGPAGAEELPDLGPDSVAGAWLRGGHAHTLRRPGPMWGSLPVTPTPGTPGRARALVLWSMSAHQPLTTASTI